MPAGLEDEDAIAGLVARMKQGEPEARATLVTSTYEDLRRLARQRLNPGSRAAGIDTTALVHEWYIRFAQAQGVTIESRAHFLRYAATVMRSVIIDAVRQRKADCRGGGAPHEPLSVTLAERTPTREEDILRVHEALEEVARLDARLVSIVEMRYFAGMSETEIAEALGVSDRTVRREWVKARLLLAEALA